MDAKCPECRGKANVDSNFQYVQCEKCGYVARYNEYIETMKIKAQNLADDFQSSWEKGS